jgi:hypothetical protein
MATGTRGRVPFKNTHTHTHTRTHAHTRPTTKKKERARNKKKIPSPKVKVAQVHFLKEGGGDGAGGPARAAAEPRGAVHGADGPGAAERGRSIARARQVQRAMGRRPPPLSAVLTPAGALRSAGW